MIKYQFLLAAALLSGVAIGYFVRPSERVTTPAEEQSLTREKAAVTDKGEAASLRALRARVAELEKALAAKAEAGITGVVETVEAPRRGPGRGENWLENLKKTDPSRYTQTTNRMAQWRRGRAEMAQNKMEFLSSIDVSQMSAAAQKTHRALQEVIERREEIDAELHREGLSNEERDALHKELRESHHEMIRLNGEERENLIGETVRQLGFGAEDTQEISQTIQDVIRMTDPFGHPRGGRSGGRRGR